MEWKTGGGGKPPTHVTGEDNFIIHSRKVFFFFSFSFGFVIQPSTPASISISAYGWIAKYISRWRAIWLSMRYLVRIGIVLNFHRHTLWQSGALSTQKHHHAQHAFISLSVWVVWEQAFRSGQQLHSTHRNRGLRTAIGGVSSICVYRFYFLFFYFGLLETQLSGSLGFSTLGSRFWIHRSHGQMDVCAPLSLHLPALAKYTEENGARCAKTGNGGAELQHTKAAGKPKLTHAHTHTHTPNHF